MDDERAGNNGRAIYGAASNGASARSVGHGRAPRRKHSHYPVIVYDWSDKDLTHRGLRTDSM